MSVQDPFRAIAILERTLRGYTLAECSREFDMSDSRCAQLANLGVQFLHSLPFARNATISKHRQDARMRVAERGVRPAVERCVATALDPAHGPTAREVTSIVTEFEAALLAAAEHQTEQARQSKLILRLFEFARDAEPPPHAPKSHTSCSFSIGQARTALAVPASSRFPTPAGRGIPRRHPNAPEGDFPRPSCHHIETQAKCSAARADRRRLLAEKTVA